VHASETVSTTIINSSLRH